MTIKPSHLVDPVERMDTAEVLSMIVERACQFVPDVPVGASNTKKSEGSISRVKFPNEESTSVKVTNEEPTRVVKVPMVTSDFVRK